MNLKCLFGLHAWSGCECFKCGKTRDTKHDWQACKCSKCGKIRDDGHDWSDSKCVVCGKARPQPASPHSWNTQKFGVFCSACGIAKTKTTIWQECPVREITVPNTKPKPQSSPAVVVSDEINPKNYKSRLQPFGNRLRYPSKYLQYLVFVDEEHMRIYYSALKRHIGAGALPPKIIEVCMVRLKDDCLPAVRAYRAPFAIVWTAQDDDDFHLWAVACLQHVNGIATRRFANHGSEDFDYVKKAIVQVYDWDILFPSGIEKDREALAKYLTDDSVPSPSPQAASAVVSAPAPSKKGSRVELLQEEANRFFARFTGSNDPKFDCRVEGGIQILSTLSDLESQIRSDAQTLSSMGPNLDILLRDLYALTSTHRSDRAYLPEMEQKVREVGELIGKVGGRHLMAAMGYRIIRMGCSEYSFSLAWDGVAGWMA